MIRIFRKYSILILLTGLSLVCGTALLSASAVAQGAAVHENKADSDAGMKKDLKFEIVSIHPYAPSSQPLAVNSTLTPDGYSATLAVGNMIRIAYVPAGSTLEASRGANVVGPSSLGQMYHIEARVSDSDREAWRDQGSKQELLRSALQSMLKERFKLVVHEQPTEVQGLQLVRTKKVLKLKAAAVGFVPPPGFNLIGGGVMVSSSRNGPHIQSFYGATMAGLAEAMTMFLAAPNPVADMTGLTGHYDFTLHEIDQPSRDRNDIAYNWPVDSLGLELKPGKIQGLNIVVDHIEKPDGN
jgi:uncharacterized protein (TIGR03435 family)